MKQVFEPRRGLTMKQKRSIAGLLFISPFLIGILFLYGSAVFSSLRYSFSQTDAEFEFYWVGWDNYYRMLFVEPTYVREIVETVGGLLVSTVVIILYSLFTASVLNRNLHGKGIFRAILFLPVIIYTGIISRVQSLEVMGTLGAVSAESTGLLGAGSIEQYILSMNLGTGFTEIIVTSIQNIYDIISRSGVQIVIFLAGLQSISPALYESAKAEGASAWESFWKITMPMMSPLIVVNSVYTVIDSFTSPDNIIMERVLGYINESINYGYASAAVWIYFVVIIAFLSIMLFVLSKFTYYEN